MDIKNNYKDLLFLVFPLLRFWPIWLVQVKSPEFLSIAITFIFLSIIAKSGITIGYEQSLLNYVLLIHGSPSIDIFMVTLTTIADVIHLVFVSLIFTIFRRTRKMGLILLICIVVISISLMYFKPLVGRLNPSFDFVPNFNMPEGFTLENDSLSPRSRDYSFPSNHISQITAFTYIIGFFLYRRSTLLGAIIWILPVIISFTKLYVFQHYLLDIIGGFYFGLIISIVFSKLLRIEEPFILSRFKGKD